MRSIKDLTFDVLMISWCVLHCVLAQNITYSEGLNSSETNRSCNGTDSTCEIVTTESTLSSEVFEFDDANSTDIANSTLSSENVTETDTNTEEVITSTTPRTDTTTEPATTTVEMIAEARPVSNEICTCDLTMDSCDINCCCDAECSEKDKQAFSSCHMRAQYNFDPRHCYQTHFIYHNNTELKIVRNPDGFFCIAKDNLPARFLYQNRRIISSLNEFNKLKRHRNIFHWSSQILSRPVFDPSKQYKAEEITWTIVNSTFVPFSLPVSVTSALCQTTKTMHFLRDWSGECSQILSADETESCENNPALSAPSYYTGFTFLSAPQFVNNSYVGQLKEGCHANICIPITVFLCPELFGESTDLENCTEVSDVQYPVFNSESGSCDNVVKQVMYRIYHNGTDGITKVCLYVWLTNFMKQRSLSQMFSVSFHWAKNDSKLFYRSGNPGYIVGKPVMSGKKVTQIINLDEDIDKEAIEVSSDPQDWLSIAAAKQNGACDLEDQKNGNSFRQTVTFGEDRWSSCTVSVNPTNFTSPSSCALMHKALIQLLAGSMIQNVTSAKQFNLHIATFGDSKVEETGDWVQVILETLPSYITSTSWQKHDWSLTCKSLITSIHIDIMFAHVGSLAIPQAKILGCVFRFGPAHDIIYTCSSKRCVDDRKDQHIKVVSSVSFIDVTKPAITEFAEPPVYEIKLPHDFFYPFFSSGMCFYPNVIAIILPLIFIISWN